MQIRKGTIMAVKEVKVNLRTVKDKKNAIQLIYAAIGFEGEAGTNLDALHDVLSAWGTPVRITFTYWKRFSSRPDSNAAGIEKVLNDVMMENRNLIFAFKDNRWV